ncbi:hypothetical protein GTS_42320 [Gandjariella thermophila]|uniref:Uncharacterized protein n=1 Tax=Gandjariella thermophila TaxID=1931992 RepID=A0A4D4JE22_9PSEU|nr:hypothetical protein GTS_42320 [Gandjariella thermophila]
MDPIAVYYPYIHVRDDTWLKYAALYWPRLGRLRPPGYPVSDSLVARAGRAPRPRTGRIRATLVQRLRRSLRGR